MPKYLDTAGVSYLWSKIVNLQKNKLIYYSKTKEQWNANKWIIAEKDVLYIYNNYKVVEKDGKEFFLPGLKFGDGSSYLIDLPFLNKTSDIQQILLDHINNWDIHVSAVDREFWNNKLNLALQGQTLILNRE